MEFVKVTVEDPALRQDQLQSKTDLSTPKVEDDVAQDLEDPLQTTVLEDPLVAATFSPSPQAPASADNGPQVADPLQQALFAPLNRPLEPAREPQAQPEEPAREVEEPEEEERTEAEEVHEPGQRRGTRGTPAGADAPAPQAAQRPQASQIPEPSQLSTGTSRQALGSQTDAPHPTQWVADARVAEWGAQSQRGRGPPPAEQKPLDATSDASDAPSLSGVGLSPVQAKRAGAGRARGGAVHARAPPEARTHVVAQSGFEGGHGRLPHFGVIQASFGRHDVSGVRAYTGAAAAAANEALGAQAYASGERVAFASSSPDLHTAAHEAAHIVQQRQGVHLAGGVGRTGDVYERHADAVADRVVAGASAEQLLDGAASGGSGPAVQAKLRPKSDYSDMKDNAVESASWPFRGHLGRDEYGNKVDDYEDKEGKQSWWAAWGVLSYLKKRFAELDVAANYWKSNQLKHQYFDPIAEEVDTEARKVVSHLEDSRMDLDADADTDELGRLNVGPNDEVGTARPLWKTFDGEDRAALDQLWATGNNAVRQQVIAVLNSGGGMLRLTSLNYVLEGIDAQHRQGLALTALAWCVGEDNDTPFFDWLADQERRGERRTQYAEGGGRAQYRLTIDGGKLKDHAGRPPTAMAWAIVMTPDMELYAAEKGPLGDPRAGDFVQHSTFLAGLPVAAAGQINLAAGTLEAISDHSGHYQGSAASTLKMLTVFQAFKVPTKRVVVDIRGRTYKANDFIAAEGDVTDLTEVVQWKRASGASVGADELPTVARAGFAGPAGALPHAERIQRSFGKHDLSGVGAFTGPQAAEANARLGSRAYASGDRIAFASPAPDLHTAAHEAAHVVQQRQGVHLDGGVGKSGDRYERHADAVADLVLRGQSAEAMLGTARGPPAAGAVQKLDDDDVVQDGVVNNQQDEDEEEEDDDARMAREEREVKALVALAKEKIKQFTLIPELKAQLAKESKTLGKLQDKVDTLAGATQGKVSKVFTSRRTWLARQAQLLSDAADARDVQRRKVDAVQRQIDFAQDLMGTMETEAGLEVGGGVSPEAEQAAQTIHDALDKIFEAREKVPEALRGKTKVQIAQIQVAYADHYGRALDDDVRKALYRTGGKKVALIPYVGEFLSELLWKSSDIEEALAYLGGDQAGGAKIALTGSQSVLPNVNLPGLHHDFTDVRKIEDTLWNMEGTELDKLRADPDVQALIGEQTADTKLIIDGLLVRDHVKVVAAGLHQAMWGSGTDEKAVYRYLRKAVDHTAVAVFFKGQYGKTVTQWIEGDFSGEEKKRALGLWNVEEAGDAPPQQGEHSGQESVDRARDLKEARGWFGSKWFNDPMIIVDRLRGMNEDDYLEMCRQFGGFQKLFMFVQEQLSDHATSWILAKSILENGASGEDDAEFDVTEDAAVDVFEKSKDHTKLLWLLETMTPAQTASIEAKFAQKYDKALLEHIGARFSGRKLHKVEVALLGVPQTTEDFVKVAIKRYDFELGSGSNRFSKFWMWVGQKLGMTEAREVLHREWGELSEMLGITLDATDEQLQQAVALLSDPQKRTATKVAKRMVSDSEKYAAAKADLTKCLTMGVSIAVYSVVVLLSAGTLSPFLTGILAAVASSAGWISTKKAMEGAAYGTNELKRDIVIEAFLAPLRAYLTVIPLDLVPSGSSMAPLASKVDELAKFITDVPWQQMVVRSAITQGVTTGLGRKGLGWALEHVVDSSTGASFVTVLQDAKRHELRERGVEPVMAKADGAPRAGVDVQAAADAGFAGPARRLPHHAAIQASFGRHDVGGVRAHVGGPARDANAALGARAYASGDQVAFREAPSLHTAAHEAAHVVQQRQGVQLSRGMGERGDRYERNADAVAEAVVAGRSAEGLLAGGGDGVRSAVQLAPADESRGPPTLETKEPEQTVGEVKVDERYVPPQREQNTETTESAGDGNGPPTARTQHTAQPRTGEVKADEAYVPPKTEPKTESSSDASDGSKPPTAVTEPTETGTIGEVKADEPYVPAKTEEKSDSGDAGDGSKPPTVQDTSDAATGDVPEVKADEAFVPAKAEEKKAQTPEGGGGGETSSTTDTQQPGAPGQVASKTSDKAAAPKLGTGDAKETMTAFLDASPSKQAARMGHIGRQVSEKHQREEKQSADALPTFRAHMQGQPVPKRKRARVAPRSVRQPRALRRRRPRAPRRRKTRQRRYRQPTIRVKGEDADAVKDAKKQINGVSTRSGVSTRLGRAPPVPLSGANNPNNTRDMANEAAGEAKRASKAAIKAVSQGRGPEQVQPIDLDETMKAQGVKAPTVQQTQQIENQRKFNEKGLPGEVVAEFDAMHGPKMHASMQRARDDFSTAHAKKEQDKAATIEQAQQDAEAANDKAQRQQEQAVAKAQGDISREKGKTVKAQKRAVDKVNGRVRRRSSSEKRKIKARVRKDQSRIKSKFRSAEKDAKGKVRDGERKAASKKRDAKKKAAEKEKGGWFSGLINAIKGAFEALAKAVADIFDAVRKAVTEVLDAAKNFATKLIDAASNFIQGAIKKFAGWLKAAVNKVLGSVLPGLARKLNAYIDKAANWASAQVKKYADQLKKGITAICDGLKKGINAVLAFYEGAIKAAIQIMQAVATGDWKALAKLILEPVLRLCNIDPKQFYGLIAKVEGTIGLIVDNPGKFVGNLIDGVAGGFKQFAGNFGKHLMGGVVSWLTGQLGATGLKLPDKWDAGGIFGLVMQITGITKPYIIKKVRKHFGDKWADRVEWAIDFVEKLIDKGPAAIWEEIQAWVGNLWTMVIDGIKGWLVTKIVTKAVLKIASMFNPVGAIVQLVLTAWDIVMWLKDNISRIWSVFTTIVESIHNIATGVLKPAMDGVERALAGLIPIAIDLLAKILGVGGIGRKIKAVMLKFHRKIDRAIDKLIIKVKDKAKTLMSKVGGKDKPSDKDKNKAGGEELTRRTSFTAGNGEQHEIWIADKGSSAQMMLASTPASAEDWEKLRLKFPHASEDTLKRSARAALAARNHYEKGKKLNKPEWMRNAKKAMDLVKKELSKKWEGKNKWEFTFYGLKQTTMEFEKKGQEKEYQLNLKTSEKLAAPIEKSWPDLIVGGVCGAKVKWSGVSVEIKGSPGVKWKLDKDGPVAVSRQVEVEASLKTGAEASVTGGIPGLGSLAIGIGADLSMPLKATLALTDDLYKGKACQLKIDDKLVKLSPYLTASLRLFGKDIVAVKWTFAERPFFKFPDAKGQIKTVGDVLAVVKKWWSDVSWMDVKDLPSLELGPLKKLGAASGSDKWITKIPPHADKVNRAINNHYFVDEINLPKLPLGFIPPGAYDQWLKGPLYGYAKDSANALKAAGSEDRVKELCRNKAMNAKNPQVRAWWVAWGKIHGHRADGYRNVASYLQAKSDRSVAPRAASVAAAGVRGTGGALPHLDRIQPAFGRHDVSHVQAFTGDSARQASTAIGARAYTMGDRVAFASTSPDLHTAAHEAAHVVQQRQGVHLKGGVGEVGDVYERHADAVADRVVQGGSAEALLDRHGQRPAGGSDTAAVQRDEEEAPAAPEEPQVDDEDDGVAEPDEDAAVESQEAAPAEAGGEGDEEGAASEAPLAEQADAPVQMSAVVQLKAAPVQPHSKWKELTPKQVVGLWDASWDACKALNKEFDSNWVVDAEVIKALKAFWVAVFRVIDRPYAGVDAHGKEVELGRRTPGNIKAARVILHTAYQMASSASLTSKIIDGCQGADERTALRLASGKEFEGQALAQAAASDPNLTVFQQGQARELAKSVVPTLYDLVEDTFWWPITKTIAALRANKDALTALLDRDDNHPKRPHDIDFAGLTPRAKRSRYQQCIHILKETYIGKTGKSLVDRISKRLDPSGDERTQLLSMLLSRPVGSGDPEGQKGPGYYDAVGQKIRELAWELAKAFADADNVQQVIVVALLQKFHDTLNAYLDPKTKGEMKTDKRDKEVRFALDLLEETYAAETGRDLADDIIANMEGQQRVDAKEWLRLDVSVPAPKVGTTWPHPKAGGYYPDTLTDEERVALPHHATTNAALDRLGLCFVVARTSDEDVVKALIEVRKLYYDLLAPQDGKVARVKDKLELRVNQAMVMLRREYDFLTGGSLEAALDDHVWNPGIKRRCLALLGSRADPTDTVVDGLLITAKGVTPAARKALTALSLEMQTLAGAFVQHAEVHAAAMGNMFFDLQAHGKSILAKASSYRAKKNAADQDPAFVVNGAPCLNGDVALKLLERHYASLRGSLRQDLLRQLFEPKVADQVFSLLGLGNADAAAKGGESLDARLGDAKGQDRADAGAKALFADQVAREVEPLSGAIERVRTAYSAEALGWALSGVRDTFAAMVEPVTFSHTEGSDQFTATVTFDAANKAAVDDVDKVYGDAAGIGLRSHLSLATNQNAGTAEALGKCTGLKVALGGVKGAGKEEGKGAELKAIGFEVPKDKATGRPLVRAWWDPDAKEGKGDYVAFNLTHAKTAARDADRYARRRDADELYRLFRWKKRTEWHADKIKEVYKILYGVPLKVTLRACFGTKGDYKRVAQAAFIEHGDGVAFPAEIDQMVADGHEEGVYRRVLKASEADKTALINDGEVMGRIRSKFGVPAYERVLKSCTGKLDAADLMAVRGEGLGTHEDEFNEDVAALFEQIKTEEKAKATAFVDEHVKMGVEGYAGLKPSSDGYKGAVARETVKRLQVRIVRMSTEERVKKALDDELSGSDLMKSAGLISGGGQLSGADKTRMDLLDDEPADTLLASLAELSAAERATLLADRGFMKGLEEKCNEKDDSGLLLDRALAILYGRKWESDILEAIDKGDTDEYVIFTSLAALSADEMADFADQVVLHGRILAELDNDEFEARLLREMLRDIGNMRKLLAKGKAGAPSKAEEHLVIQHMYALKAAIPEGPDRLLGKAQKVFGETKLPAEGADKPGHPRYLIAHGQKDDRGNTVRAGVMPMVKSEYGNREIGKADNKKKVHALVEDAILAKADPSTYRVERQFSGADADDEDIDDTVDSASAWHVARHWSNIRQHGERFPSLRWVFDQYLERRDAKGQGPDKELAVADWRQRFRDTELDLSATLVQTFMDEGFLSSTSEKRVLDLKTRTRKRVLALEADTVIKALNDGVSDKNAQVPAGDLHLEERRARSEYEHHQDTYAQQMDQGSAIDLWNSGRTHILQASLSYSMDLDKLIRDGGLSEEDIAVLNSRRAEFEAAIKDYKKAKEAAAATWSFIAAAIVGVVVSILTGGAASPMMAALMTAAGAAMTAATKALVNEAFLGRDFEMTQEGVKGIVTGVTVDLLTLGVGKFATHAFKNTKFLKWANDLQAKVKGFKEGLKEAAEASGSHWQYFKHVVADAGFSTLESQIKNVPTAAINAVDVGMIYTEGWKRGMQKTNEEVGKAVSGIPENALKDFFTGALTAYVKKYAPELLKKKNAKLPGSTTPTPLEITDPGGRGARWKDSAKKAFIKTFYASEEEALGAIGTFLATKTGEVLGTLTYESVMAAFGDDFEMGNVADMPWSDGDAEAFVMKYLKGRFSTFTAEFGKAAGDAAKLKKVYTTIRHHQTQGTLAKLDNDPDINTHGQAAYVAYLMEGGDREWPWWRSKAWKTKPLTAAQWRDQYWNKGMERLDGLLPDDVDPRSKMAMDYKRYLLSDVSKMHVKLIRLAKDEKDTYAVFEQQSSDAQTRAAALKKKVRSKNWLTPEQRRYYNQYLDDPLRLRNFLLGEDKLIDVSDKGERARFTSMFLATKKSMATTLAEKLMPATTPKEDKKAVLDAIDAVTDPNHGYKVLPRLELDDEDGNEARMLEWIQAVQ